MDVTKISASLRFSAPRDKGWKTVEIGAEATVTEGENWEQAQQRLYGDLSNQLRSFWSGNGNGRNTSNNDDDNDDNKKQNQEVTQDDEETRPSA